VLRLVGDQAQKIAAQFKQSEQNIRRMEQEDRDDPRRRSGGGSI
jgi:hypothetical protein